MHVSSLQSAISTLQECFQEKEGQVQQLSADAVRQRAARLQFPDPELAAQVYATLQQQRGPDKAKRFSEADISDAFIAILMDDDKASQLGVKQKQNPWVHTRSALRNAGALLGKALNDIHQVVSEAGLQVIPPLENFGKALEDIHDVVSTTGMGYVRATE